MGMGKMMCVLVSEKISEDNINDLLERVVFEVRKNREKSFVLIIIASSIKNAFRYRDAFTKYVDVGVRLYIGSSIQEVSEVLKNCRQLFCSTKDYGLKGLDVGKAFCI